MVDPGLGLLGARLDLGAFSCHGLSLGRDVLFVGFEFALQLLDLLHVAQDRFLVIGDLSLDGVDLVQHRRVLTLILDLHQVGHELLLADLERAQLARAHALVLIELRRSVP